jgi:hypothetical protein
MFLFRTIVCYQVRISIIHLHNRPFAQIVYAGVNSGCSIKVGFDTVLLPLIFRQ